MQGINIDYLVAVYIIPALIHAIHLMQKDIRDNEGFPGDYESAGWALAIKDRLDQLNINIMDDNIVLNAHKLANNPINSSSTHIIELFTGGYISNED